MAVPMLAPDSLPDAVWCGSIGLTGRVLMKCKLPALLALSIVCASQAAADQFNQFLSFGDSTLDSGWWSGALQGQCDGAPSPCTTGSTFKNTVIGNAIALGGGVVGAPVGIGQMNTQVLAGFFNLTALPVNQPGDTNFAIAGATDAATVTNGNIGNLNPNGTLPSTVQQITNYLNSQQNHLANPQALYVIGSGGNDVTFARDNITTGLADQHAYLTAQANALAAAIINLQSKGAQHIIVNGLPNSGGNPMSLAAFYTNALFTALSGTGVILADVAGFTANVEAHPLQFGFTQATVLPGVVGTGTGSACVWTPPSGSTLVSGWGQWCADTTTPPRPTGPFYAYLGSPNAEQTSFWSDDQHFSAEGQMLEAEFDLSLLGVPGPIAGAGLPGLIVAGGGGLLAWRRRRQKAA
jgi:hypothetical protein